MKKKTIIVIAVIVILLIVSFSFGYFLGQKRFSDVLGSKTVVSLFGSVQGEVVEISGRNLTLKKEDSILNVLIKEGAPVERLTFSEKEKEERKVPEPKEASFGEIKVGDELSVMIRLNPDGTFTGEKVFILSSSEI